MPDRAAPSIRRILSDAPGTTVRFIDAMAPESFYLSTENSAQILYLNPVHRQLVDELSDR